MPVSRVELPPFGNDPGRVRWSKRVGDVVVKGEPPLTIDFDYEQVVPFLAPMAGRRLNHIDVDGEVRTQPSVRGARVA